jgi:hypothetical protein
MSARSRLVKLLTGAPAAAGGAARMVEAVLEDVVAAADLAGVTGAQTPRDPF